jgi:hypothetical protein
MLSRRSPDDLSADVLERLSHTIEGLGA